MFYDQLIALCKRDGVSPSTLTQQLGYSKGTFSNWKKGATPNGEVIVRFAEHFNVTTDYLLLGIENNSVSFSSKVSDITFENNFDNQITVDEHNLLQTYREVDNVGKNKIQDSIREIWIEHRNPKNKLSHSEENLNDTTAWLMSKDLRIFLANSLTLFIEIH